MQGRETGKEGNTQIRTPEARKKATEIERAEILCQSSIVLTPIQEAELEVVMAALAVAKEAICITDSETLRARNNLVELQKSFLLDQ